MASTAQPKRSWRRELSGAGVRFPRAFHASALLPNGQVLVHGGERAPVPVSTTLVYDVNVGRCGPLGPRQQPLTDDGCSSRARRPPSSRATCR
ncbi:MAG: hypothetical protein JNK82_19035 [Myxococcaceae bacterium]|nr:hypothetical protein [Myxococcaceae bacterium]